MILTQSEIKYLVREENVNAINCIYPELPVEAQRIIDQMIANWWNKEVSELADISA